jgi:NAD(P)-dependent dehydrogenase (short-subunit alcohol dehydrogenase family)
VIEVNLTAPFLMREAVLPAMRASTTAASLMSRPRRPDGEHARRCHYTASKAGILGLTRAAQGARQVRHHRERHLPGMIDTELTREHASDELLERLAASYPVARPRNRAKSPI